MRCGGGRKTGQNKGERDYTSLCQSLSGLTLIQEDPGCHANNLLSQTVPVKCQVGKWEDNDDDCILTGTHHEDLHE